MTTPAPKRRWYQYRLRTLLVLVLFASIGMSWVAVRMERARRQQAALAAIGKSGPMLCSTEGAAPPGLGWLESVLGEGFFTRVVELRINHSKTTNADLAHLRDLPELRLLLLDGPNVTDAGLAHLEGLPHLQTLWLYRAPITDAGLEHLGSVPHLERLVLHDTRVTKEGVEKFRGSHPRCREMIIGPSAQSSVK